MRTKTLIFIIFIGCLLGPQANATQLVVIASNTIQFNPGAIIEMSQEITLPAEATITLISEDGGTIKLSGPYKGKLIPVVSIQNRSLIKTLSEIATKERTSALGGFRNIVIPPDFWYLNVNKAGSYCVRGNVSVYLRRSQSNADSKLTITPLNKLSDATTLDWPGSQRAVKWPDSLPLIDGQSYSMKFVGEKKDYQLKIRIIPNEYTTDVHRAAWAWENGCNRQARHVVRELAGEN